jgi:hypothetical protein
MEYRVVIVFSILLKIIMNNNTSRQQTTYGSMFRN